MTVSQVSQDRIAARAKELQDKLSTLRAQLQNRAEAESGKVPTPPQKSKANSIFALPEQAAERLQVPDRNPDRPQNLEEMIGQTEVVMRLRTRIAGAQLRGERMSHVLISGAPGMGKTSLAEIVATELECPLISTTGMLLKRSQDLAGLIMGSTDGGPAVLWIDEAHALGSSAAEAAYQILEDGKLDVLASSGPNTVATTYRVPNLVVVAATTRMGLLSQPFRDRFGLKLVMDEYSQDELAEIVARYWKSRGVKHFKGETHQVAQRSRNVPRNAVTMANLVLDYAAVTESPKVITTGMVAKAADLFGIDSLGLDSNDRRVLGALTGEFCGRSIGIDALAAHCDIDAKTISETIEPFLSRSGWLLRTGRGRLATAAAYDLMRSP